MYSKAFYLGSVRNSYFPGSLPMFFFRQRLQTHMGWVEGTITKLGRNVRPAECHVEYYIPAATGPLENLWGLEHKNLLPNRAYLYRNPRGDHERMREDAGVSRTRLPRTEQQAIQRELTCCKIPLEPLFFQFISYTPRPSILPRPFLRSEPLVPWFLLPSSAIEGAPNSREDSGHRGSLYSS